MCMNDERISTHTALVPDSFEIWHQSSIWSGFLLHWLNTLWSCIQSSAYMEWENSWTGVRSTSMWHTLVWCYHFLKWFALNTWPHYLGYCSLCFMSLHLHGYLLLNWGTRFHEACVPKVAPQLLMTIFISQHNSHLSTWTLMPIDVYYIHGLHAPVCSIYWWTPHVQVLYPVHYASTTNDINCAWVPSHLSMYALGHQTPLASRLLSAQLIDGLSMFSPLPVCDLLDVQVLLCLCTTQNPLLVCYQRCPLLGIQPGFNNTSSTPVVSM